MAGDGLGCLDRRQVGDVVQDDQEAVGDVVRDRLEAGRGRRDVLGAGDREDAPVTSCSLVRTSKAASASQTWA